VSSVAVAVGLADGGHPSGEPPADTLSTRGRVSTAVSTSRSPGPDEQYCSSCGEVIKQAAEICPECGVRLRDPPGRAASDKKLIAALLALVFGVFGIHKFYLGQRAQGGLYLLFFWTLIPALLALIDAARYLLMDDETFEERYLSG
jgi:TM2 domain-containing membrane protein YozV